MPQGAGRRRGGSPVADPSEIRRVLGAERQFLDVSTGTALADVTAFLLLARDRGFIGGARLFFKDDAISLDPLRAVEQAAERLAGRLDRGASADLFKKSLEEAFLDASGLTYDLDLLDVDWGVKKFLITHGIPGFLELFLGLYLFHSMWVTVQESVLSRLPDERAFLDLMATVRKMSDAAVSGVAIDASRQSPLDPVAGVQLMSQLRDRVLGPADPGQTD